MVIAITRDVDEEPGMELDMLYEDQWKQTEVLAEKRRSVYEWSRDTLESGRTLAGMAAKA